MDVSRLSLPSVLGPGLNDLPEFGVPLEIGKGRILREGSAVALLSLGTRAAECLKAAEQLAGFGLSTTVADARFAKPLDEDLIRRLARELAAVEQIDEPSAVEKLLGILRKAAEALAKVAAVAA